MPYGYLSTETDGAESSPYQALMDTGSSLIIVVMDAAEDLLNLSPEEIKAERDHVQEIQGFGGDGIGYAWRTDLRLRASQNDVAAMLIPGAWMYVIDAPNIVGYPALFGQRTGFEQRWFKQHNHTKARYWQLREWA
jgi:hypothetical protein